MATKGVIPDALTKRVEVRDTGTMPNPMHHETPTQLRGMNSDLDQMMFASTEFMVRKRGHSKQPSTGSPSPKKLSGQTSEITVNNLNPKMVIGGGYTTVPTLNQ